MERTHVRCYDVHGKDDWKTAREDARPTKVLEQIVIHRHLFTAENNAWKSSFFRGKNENFFGE